MFIFHVVVVLSLILFALYKSFDFSGDRPDFKFSLWTLFVPLAFLYVFVVPSSIGQIETSQRGIVLHFGSPTGEVKGEGIYMVTPFVSSVVVMDLHVQTDIVTGMQTASSDLQQVTTDLALNYQLDSTKLLPIYYKYGNKGIQDTLITPSIQSLTKTMTSKYSASELVTKRVEARQGLEDLLTQKLQPEGVIITAANLTNFSFSKEYETAIEANAVAQQTVNVKQQELEQVKVDAQKQVAQAQGAADAKVATANGDAKSTQITAEANANAIKLKADALAANANVVGYEAVQKWNGTLPVNMYGSSPLPFINVQPQSTK